MAKDYVEILKIKQEEESEIKKNSPASLPLNPTAQGWSGSEIRKKLSHSIIGEKGSVLSLLGDRIEKIAAILNEFEERTNLFEEYDVLIGTARLFTTTGPMTGYRTIDGVTLREGDKVLVTGQGVLNGVYIAKEGQWVRMLEVKPNQVVSIDEGVKYGGSMQKKLANGATTTVKNPERSKWKVFN